MKIPPGDAVRVQAVLDSVPADAPLPLAHLSLAAFRQIAGKKQS